MNKKVKIFVMVWNGFDITCKCLNSLFNINYPNYDILLLDNGSEHDMTKEYLKKFPQLQIIRLKKNIGFTGGSNFAIKHCIRDDPDFICFVSNDVEVDPNFINEMLNVADMNPEIGIVSPKIYYYDHKNSNILWWDGGRFDFLKAKGVHINFKKKDSFKNILPREITFFTGCVYMARKDFFEKVGFFDDDYFNYSEDADLSIRAIGKKIKIYYAPKAIVYHKESFDIKNNKGKPYQIYYLVRNNLLIVKKHYALYYKIPVFIYLLFKYFCYNSLYYLVSFDKKSFKSIYIAVFDYIRGNFGRKKNL